jgi:proteasome lid subunit RPN8/RPN11
VITELVVDKRVLEQLKRHLLRYYPKEHIEALWGRVRGDSAHVYAIGELEKHKATSESVEYEPEPAEHLEGTGYVMIGSVHSHPFTSAEPSDIDWHDFLRDEDECAEDLVMGVCGIRKQNGRRFVSWKFFNKDGEPLELVIAE